MIFSLDRECAVPIAVSAIMYILCFIHHFDRDNHSGVVQIEGTAGDDNGNQHPGQPVRDQALTHDPIHQKYRQVGHWEDGHRTQKKKKCTLDIQRSPPRKKRDNEINEMNEINENPLFFVYLVHFVYFVISLLHLTSSIFFLWPLTVNTRSIICVI